MHCENGVEWTEVNQKQLLRLGMPHDFLVLRDTAEVLYKATNYYSPKDEIMIEWNDKTIGIEWQLGNVAKPLDSYRDLMDVGFNLAEVFA